MYDYLWIQHTNPNLELPALTTQMIKDTESKLGVQLPQSFIQFCHIQNGGTLAKNDYYNPKYNVEFTVNSLLGIDPNNGIGSSFTLQEEWGIPKDLIIISDEEDDWIALDYRKKTKLEPSVVWFNAEKVKICTIAKNFEDFIQTLVDPHFKYTKEILNDFDEE